MAEPGPPPSVQPAGKPAVERGFELWLFRSRWLMAPFYVVLVAALAGLFVVMADEGWHGLSNIRSTTPEQMILLVLSLIDLSLAGNLLVIVILSGYENFVARIQPRNQTNRPAWMGSVDFSDMKVKLGGSIIAISAIALLRTFMRLSEGEEISDHSLRWLVILHLTFVASGILLAAMAWIAERKKD
jgi:uncharacterized protein (TIGR00645 family)